MPKLPPLSKEDLDKVERLKKGANVGKVIPRELYFLAEFGYYFGWDGIHAIETDEISLDRAMEILEATRKVHSDKMAEESLFSFYASKDAKNYNKGITKVKDSTRVD